MQAGQHITLDFIIKNHTKLIAKQNDTNSRFIIATIKNNRQAATIPQSATATLNITRQDGAKKCYRAIIENNKVMAFLSDWAVSLTGVLKCDISIIENNERLTTMPFTVDIVFACCTSDDIEDATSEDVITELIEMLGEYKEEKEHLAEIDSTLEEHSEIISTLTNNVDRITDNVNLLGEEVNALSENVTLHATAIQENTENIGHLNNTVTSHTSNIATNISNISSLSNTVSEHTTSIGTLEDTVSSHAATINSIKCKRTILTLTASNWVLNSNSNLYEYTITDNTITANHYIEGIMDFANQDKMEDGYIESYNGSYKFITSTAPTENITVTVVIRLTEEVS